MISMETGELLARGGMLRSYSPGDDTEDMRWSKYNGAQDPAGVERLGVVLAAGLRDRGADAVLIWEHVEDLVLAHVVARELGVAVIRAFDFDGLVSYAGTFPERPRVVLLADAFQDSPTLQALRALVAQQGGAVVALAALVPTSLVAGDPTAKFLPDSGEAATGGVAR